MRRVPFFLKSEMFRWTLLLLITLIFVGGLFYTNLISKSNSRDITEVQEKAFPVLERINLLKLKLRLIQEKLYLAVLAEEAAKVLDVEKEEVVILDIMTQLRQQADYLPALATLRPAFQEYIQLGESVARYLIVHGNDFVPIQRQIAEFTEKGKLLSEKLEELSVQSQNNFISVLKHSKDNSELMLQISFFSSVSGFLLMGGVLIVIFNLNRRLAHINRNLAGEVKSRTAELESFVYTISHDLKAPVVSMNGMASLLMENHSEQLGERERYYVQRIIANAAYMEELIQGLLVLSRIGKKQEQPEPVDARSVITQIVDIQKERFAEKRIAVVVQPSLPHFVFDRTALTQIFQNLILNSAKFMGDQPHPTIEIGGKLLRDAVRFYVKDNGIGIDPEYHAKIFGIFQRLKEIEVEGTGVGLSIVKKVVDLAGGRVWIESKKGEGATFFVQLPRIPKSPSSSSTWQISSRKT
ncbi:MAG: hypothetical protein EPO39_13185 [Candidatus Manganitrophaceae bacterium]|nr:MAG: hypothetical protein EPO39_13185 [Candidatus Manganitrophaceae bacterium]